MNQADIFKLAETAGFAVEIESRFSAKIWALNQCRFEGTCHADVTDELTRFAELVAQHESERIAAEQQRNARANKNSSSIYKVDFGNDERSPGDKYAGCD